MTSTGPSPHRVLIVDNDMRLRRALTELVNASDGFVAVGADPDAVTDATGALATVALVVVGSSADRAGLTRVQALAGQLPVVAVSTASSVADSATAAGATSFCEMDGDTDALIAALSSASDRERTR